MKAIQSIPDKDLSQRTYRPRLHGKPAYPPMLRLEMNRTRVRCYNANREAVDAHKVDWQRQPITPIIKAASMWTADGKTGLSF